LTDSYRDDTDTLARLIAPRFSLAGCIFAAIIRDTRSKSLSEADRYNFFPASPLCAVSWFFEGESRLIVDGWPPGSSALGRLPRFSISGPQSRPMLSWNPGPVFAMTVGFYPDAWQLLTGRSVEAIFDQSIAARLAVDGRMATLLESVFGSPGDAQSRFDGLQDALEPVWAAVRPAGFPASHRLQDWTRSVARRAVVSRFGQSARQAQRRIKSLTGATRRSLDGFANVEALYERYLQSPERRLADIAADHGFADQSHMGREVRRVTGLSPARLNAVIATAEPFWVYRLFGERF